MQRIFTHIDSPNKYRSSVRKRDALEKKKYFSLPVNLINLFLEWLREYKMKNVFVEKVRAFLVSSC